MTDKNGRMHPIWYEFLRSFVATTESVTGASVAVTQDSIVAGAGLVKSTDEDAPNDVILNVGAGSGITVNANDVNIDISNQADVQATLGDELLISDVSDNNNIRKTQISDIVDLVEGAVPGGSDTQIQYNDGGTFGGDSGFTTDGAGSVDITGDLDVDNININGNTLATNSSSNPFIFTVPAGGLNQFTFTQSGAASSAYQANFIGLKDAAIVNIGSDADSASATSVASVQFSTNGTAKWGMGAAEFDSNNFIFAVNGNLNTNAVYTIAATGRAFTHHTDVNIDTYVLRNTTAGITASTTQTQGQGALTAEVNEVSTVANANDTVTLPTAVAGTEVTIINNGANTLQIFPAADDNLGSGVDTATTLASGSNVKYIAFDAVNWEAV